MYKIYNMVAELRIVKANGTSFTIFKFNNKFIAPADVQTGETVEVRDWETIDDNFLTYDYDGRVFNMGRMTIAPASFFKPATKCFDGHRDVFLQSEFPDYTFKKTVLVEETNDFSINWLLNYPNAEKAAEVLKTLGLTAINK